MRNWIFVLSLSVSLMTTTVIAATARERATEAKIEDRLRVRAPQAVEKFIAATAAFDAEKYSQAEPLYRDVVAADPEFDPALRRLGSVIALQGRQSEGVALIERALTLDRSVANLLTLARTIAFPTSGKAPGADLQRALALLNECKEKPEGDDPDVWTTRAQLMLSQKDEAGFRVTVAELQKRYPKLMATHYFAAIVAAMDEHWVAAAREIRIAEKLGLPTSVAQGFLDSGIGSRATIWKTIGIALWTVALWALGLTLLFAVGLALSRFTLGQIERADPAVPVSPSEHRLRRLYRAVLNICGIYYYISLPVVAVLVVGLSAAVIYGFLMLGHIPIKLALLAVIGAVATVWAMGKSLLLKVEQKDLGRELRVTRRRASGNSPKKWRRFSRRDRLTRFASRLEPNSACMSGATGAKNCAVRPTASW